MRRALAVLAVIAVAGLIALALWPTGVESVDSPRSAALPSRAGADVALQPERTVASRPTDAEPSAGVLEGEVIDSFTGRPVADAVVAFSNDRDETLSAKTDARGLFAVPTRPPGPYFLSSLVSADYQPLRAASRDRSPVVISGAARNLRFKLDPWVDRIGAVVDLDENPVAGATLSVREPRPGATVIVTDGLGYFTFRPIGGERWVIRHPGFLDHLTWPEYGDPSARMHYELVPVARPGAAYKIEGRVIDPADAGVSRVEITARAVSGRYQRPSGPAQRATSETSGHFELRVDTAGVWSVETARLPDVDSPSELVFVDGGTTDVELRLEDEGPGGVLTGNVTGPTGAPVENFIVAFLKVSTASAQMGLRHPEILRSLDDVVARSQRFVSTTGQFRISAVRSGVNAIVVRTADFEPEYRAVDLAPGAETRCDVTLHDAATVTGVISSAKTHVPIARASVRLVGSRVEEVRTGADGSFALRGLPAGSGKQLIVVAENCQPLQFPLTELAIGRIIGPLKIELSEKNVASDAPQIIGIGIQAGWEKGEELLIKHLIAGGGALSAGMQVGDNISAVDGESCTGKTQEEVFARLRGSEGSIVRVTVQRGKQSLDLNVVRRRLNL